MLKREVWNNVLTLPWRNFRLPLFALAIILIASSVGDLKKTQGQSSSTCNLAYQENTFWNVGFQGQVTIMNSGPAINGWTVTFTFPDASQTIYELWNGVFTQTGQNVTVTNASYNASIPTGGSVSFGFNANWSGSHPAPTGLTLNGVSCGGGGGGPTIQTSVTTLNVNEGASAQFGVKLSSAPASNVTVNVARLSGDTDLTVSGGATLTFTPTNFGTFQNVTISAAEDADSTNGSAVFRVSSTGLPNVDVTANEVDNDPAAIAIQTSVTTMNVNEGASVQFGVRLASAPASNVTVNVARLSGDTDLTVSAGGTLTFTPTNFGTFQNVTISAAEDADTTNGTAVFRASGTGLTSADVTINEVDNDSAPIAIQTSVTTLSVNEGASAQFGVRLASAPTSNVTVNVARLSGDTDLTVSAGGTLTFTPTNFGTFQNVTISAAEDADSANGTAIFRASGTGLTNADVNVSEVDNDPVVIAIQTSVATLNVNEGASAQFGVRLASAPASNVTVNVARLSGDTDLTVSGGATLTFTPANFGTFQNVTISAAEDADSTNGTAVIRASATGLTSADVNVSEVDNDPILIQTSVATLNVNEGATAQFGVRLATAPASNVTVTVARLSGDTDLTVSAGGTLTFTPTNFGTFQNVTISAAEDVDLTNGSAVFRASGTGLTNADVTANEVDNDAPIQILTNIIRPPLVAIENDSGQVGLRLASAPPTNVTVTLTRVSGDANLKVVLPGTVTFTPTDFATFKNVAISAAEDANITNETAVFRASGTGLTSVDFNVSSFDNDGLPVAQRTFTTMLNGASEVPPVVTPATGTSSIIISPDETSALVNLNWTGLSAPETAAHLHGPAPPGNNAGVVLDEDMPLGPVVNFLWDFHPEGGLTTQGLIDALKGGQLYTNVHSANNPGGEIRGWFFVVDPGGGGGGGGTSGGLPDAARFLEQATFGPTVAETNRVLGLVPNNFNASLDAWLNEQFAAPITGYGNLVQLPQAGTFVNFPVKLQFFRNAMTGQDQLRQRVAWALSQIVVAANVGDQDTTGNPTAMVSQYHDILLRNAFGSYKTLLSEMSVSPIMGTYLTLVNSQKRNTVTNTQPDENFARELWQLFTIGTFRLNPDGTVMLDGQGRPLETYTITEIQESARALTGWNYAPAAGQPNQGNNNPLNPFAPMITNPANHDTGSKTLLSFQAGQPGQVIQANQTVEQDLASVIDNAFMHPNVGPFIGRQLIQHLVTSNPSPAYVARITAVFNNNGSNQRGDLKAVVRAILMDQEARGDSKADPAYGKLREPAIFLTHLFRALTCAGQTLSLNCTGGMWGIPQRSRRMGQDVFSPPSVFSYYQPDFRVVVNGQSIFAPPAQILTTSTIIERLNLLHEFLFAPPIQPGSDPNPTGTPTTSVVFDFAPWDQLAPNPASLVDNLNMRLMHGSMSPQMRQTVIDAVTSIQNNNRLRVQTAIYTIASSMQYQVQR
jgi:uncharacterized protein (DUF1800 family)